MCKQLGSGRTKALDILKDLEVSLPATDFVDDFDQRGANFIAYFNLFRSDLDPLNISNADP